MDLATGEFSKYADLYQPRIYSGPYGAFTGLILFSGGYPLGSNESKSSEVFLDAADDSGPFHFHTADLPTPRKQHCSVFDNTVNQDGNWPGWWITGGRIGESENKTYSGDVTSSMFSNVFFRPLTNLVRFVTTLICFRHLDKSIRLRRWK